MLIVGGKERSEGTVSVRRHKEGDIGTFDFSEFISNLIEEIDNKEIPDHLN